ncbi:MAG: flagellar filament capping protein FliD [Phycisphaerales bacterium]|nr:MAG: flagellar filament capping protein FliD [Phycisphaerales bacterium]
MGTITTGIGLMSGIDYGAYIDAIIEMESTGKYLLQQRVAVLQAQQTAMMDINARLLNLKNAAGDFRTNSVFQSAIATSSDPDVLTATAGISAQPGTFTFIVKQLVANSQKLTGGYATTDATPLGLTALSFEFGKGGLAVDKALEDLNGGDGVARGRIIITDRDDNQATIDLTDVISLNEVLERINDSTDISVTATVDGDHLVITDTSGGSGTLTVANATGYTTATDLGIAGSAAGNTLTGTDINTLGLGTALTSLNDGNGVLTRNNVADFRITARDGTLIDVDLGRIDADITTDTLLADLNNGAGVTISDDEENPDIKFIARDGTEYEVDLTGVTTVGGLITRVSTETGGHLELSITDGERLTVTDTVGGAENLKVLGAGDNDTDTAEDLGILNETGVAADSFDGDLIPNTIQDPAATTIGEVIDRINNAENNGGKIVAALGDDGVSLKLTDTTGGGGDLIVAASAANPYAASALGLETAGVASDTLNGERLIAALGSVLVRNLNGGDGLNGATSVTITDRAGASLTINDLDTYDSLSEIVTRINDEADGGGVAITASLNSAGTGLLITDTSGSTAGNLVVSGDGATALGIEADVADTTVVGTNLQLRYVSEAARLEDLNYGRGIGTGSFRITDGFGESAVVSIGSDAETLYDIIAEINSKGLAINARINDNGDGLLIEEAEDTEDQFVALKVEAVSGSTAQDLNILGESDTVEDGYIDGSYEQVIELDESDTLAEVVSAVNDAGIPATASIINTGSGSSPYRITFSSLIDGARGELIIDPQGADLGLTTLSAGRDAKVFFGSDDPEDAFLLTSSSNSIDDVVSGLTIELVAASDDAVTVTIERDTTTIIDAVKQLVTTFNDAIGRIDQYDFFDVDTEEKGVLLGDPTASRVRTALFRVVQGSVEGVDTQYQYLSQVGIKVGSDGQLTFDQDKFETAYANDPEAVENLFATYEATTNTTEEIADGVTVTKLDPTVTARGIGQIFDDLLDGLTNSIDGTMTLADQSFTDMIELANDRIADFDERLEARRARLERQFVAMERAIALLQSQSSAIASIQSLITASNTTG